MTSNLTEQALRYSRDQGKLDIIFYFFFFFFFFLCLIIPCIGLARLELELRKTKYVEQEKYVGQNKICCSKLK